MQVANIYPNRVSIYTQKAYSYDKLCASLVKSYDKKDNIPTPSLDNLKKKKSTLELSRASRNQLLQSMNCLTAYSKPRTIFRKNKNPIYNYRSSFITLTLPSIQEESDTEIKSCLNLFFTDLRRVYGLENYVWRSEIQKNGNVHFHIGVDKYIDFHVLKNYWLKALRHTSQVRRYQKKFSKMTFIEYSNYRILQSAENGYNMPSHQQLVNGYAYGKRTNWLSPPVLDVRNIQNTNQVSAYVAKYMGKSSHSNLSKERIENFGKVWARSQSLAKIKFKFPVILEDLKEFISDLVKTGSVYTKIYDYSTVHYFKFKSMPAFLKSKIQNSLLNVALTFSYPFPAG